MNRQLGSIERLRTLWQDETSSAAKHFCVAVMMVGLVAAALVGRAGLAWSRAAAAAIVVIALLPTISRWLTLRRHASDPRSVMNTTIGRTDPDVARAARRALDLSRMTTDDPRRGSSELAHLHFARVLGRASMTDVEQTASASAWRSTVAALLLALAGFGMVISDPFRVVEGLDVIAARDGVAPVAIEWLQLPHISAEPPPYLNLKRTPLRPHFPTALNTGTVVTIKASALIEGRRLVLTDGRDEVAFRDDGDGELTARWTVTDDVLLQVAARFGDVLIPEPVPLEIHAIPDHAPHVQLQGAPDTIRLLDQPQIAIHWQATDDHGLREVALVLRSGEQEIRRKLSKQQGGGTVDRGGVELHSDDPFLKKSYLPVEVSVQALDNDPVTGPKWGRSEVLVLIPPQVAEREAMRYRGLLRGRDAVTDLLAARLEADLPKNRAALIAHERTQQQRTAETLRAAINGDYGGLRVSGRIAALVRGQLELLDKALAKLSTGAIDESYASLVQRSENIVLAVDSVLGAMGTRDTRTSAMKLSDVAADAASAISESRDRRAHARASRRLAANIEVLSTGADHLLVLGSLGRDIGAIVHNGVRRIDRAWALGDRYHAQLAAEDLAARLRHPDPSFGSGGGHGHGGGVESGSSGQQSEGESSQAAEQAAGLDAALEQLRQQHQQLMDEVERALRESMSQEQREQMQDQLRQTARELREAVEGLPRQAADPASARAAAATGRSAAESAAAAMERGDLDQAVEQGSKALESLERAAKQGGDAPSGTSDRATGDAAGVAQQQLQQTMERAREQLQQLRDKASRSAKSELDKAARREAELAKQARELRRQSQQSEAPLPDEMLDRLNESANAMDEASKQLGRGRGNRGLDKQREAQRLLEMSQPERDDGSQGSDAGDGTDFARDADVPEKKGDERADGFRKRVIEGLGRKAPPHLREAIRRYTDGLLR